jgi:hypothetical protein
MTKRSFWLSIPVTTAVFLFAASASSQNLVIVSMTVGECELRVESNENWKTLRLRAHHQEYRGCHITKDDMLLALAQAFMKKDPPVLEGVYSSLSIGRLIDFPWLSQYLATTAHSDPGWDPNKGKPTVMDINKYVSQLLFRKDLMGQIEGPFARDGYQIVGVTAEKVLVGSFSEVPFYQGGIHPGKVPFDAQVWFRLKKWIGPGS